MTDNKRVLPLAAEVAGLTQQALEKLHELTTYEMTSASVFRHRGSVEQIRRQLTDARNLMAALALHLGKEAT